MAGIEPFQARLMGRIDGCTNPESAELTIDDETFVFGNCALTMGIPGYRGGNGIVYLQGNAFISRARIDPSGSIELVERQLVTGLTATLGIDILRKATRRFPTGTAFVAEGGRPICHPASRELLTNVDLIRPRALAFDPETGEVRGEIPLWDGSAIANRFNALDQPNGLAVDAKGNLYVGDIPNSNPVDTRPPPVDSAVYRIPHDALDALAARDDESAARNVARIEVPGFVNGVTSSPVDDSIWIVSCSEHDPVRGGIYQLSERDFDRGTLPPPRHRDLGILDGVAVSRRGTVFASNPLSGEIHAFPTNGNHHVVQLDGENIVSMPADFNLCYPSALNGEPALLVTHIDVGGSAGGAQVVVVDISTL